MKQVYIERASRVIVLCDSSKFGRMSVVRVVVAGGQGSERAERPGP